MPDANTAFTPTTADNLNHQGAVLLSNGHVEAARLHFLGALQSDPRHYMALQNMGAALRAMGHHRAALSFARLSVEASGGNAYTRANLGVSLMTLRQFDAATEIFQSVVTEMPNEGPMWHNYGLTFYSANRFKEAAEAMEQAIKLMPDHNILQSDLSLTLLQLGHIQDALRLYESRWAKLYRNCVWDMGIAEWKGESLMGKRVVFHHEQGFGDSLMLVRFAKDLQLAGAEVTIAVPPELRRLFAFSFGPLGFQVCDWDQIKSKKAEDFDYHTPMLSAMRWLRYSSPSQITFEPYLKAPFTSLKVPDTKHKIGIVWASGKHGPELEARRRLVPLVDFIPLMEIPNLQMVSLQVGDGARDVAAVGMEGVIYDMAARINDFADTASVISQLDLVVSVDSAVAHLAGAMGKPTIVLSPFTRCWRWWGAEQGKSDLRSGWPWYESMAVLFQSADGSWTEATDKMRELVKEFVADRS
jgi:Flp pilus assembly protein TadD